MNRLYTNTLMYYHALLTTYLQKGDVVIDATAGKGYDTVFLAKCVGQNGLVHAVDIQQQAIEETRARLEKEGLLGRVRLHQMDHAVLGELDVKDVAVIIFNLGYLPGYAQVVMTQGNTTIQAMAQSLNMLRKHGLMLLTVYPGTVQGCHEHHLIQRYIAGLDQKQVDVVEMRFPNRVNASPYGILLQKLV